ncbi:MAG: FHA domain-containing protein [bacterium]|nr:FHA domain-containing protein [bacterium]
MGKRVVRIVIAVILSAFFINTTSVYAQTTGIQIEQVYVNMPDLTTYIITDKESLQKENVIAFLGDEQLTTESVDQWNRDTEGMDYYVLVDISGSIKRDFFTGVTEGILQLSEQLGPKDRLILVTFGEQVTTVLDGSESRETAAEKISSLKRGDQITLFYEALSQMTKMIEKTVASESQRSIAVIISDGEDVAVGKTTKDEALDTLISNGIPVYGIAPEYAQKEYVDAFGEFTRATGGTLTTAGDAVVAQSFAELQEYLESAVKVLFRAKGNQVSNSIQTMSIQFPDADVTKTKEVGVYRWQKDSEAPTLLGAEKSGSNQMTLTFSEAVDAAEDVSNYQVMLNGVTAAVITTAGYVDDSKTSVVLTMAEDLIKGDYTVTCMNITDCSMEKNEISNEVEQYVDGVEAVTEVLEEVNPVKKFLQDWWWTLVIAGVLLLAVVILCVYKAVKKNGGIVYIDGKPSFVSKVSQKQHVSIEKPNGKHLILIANGKNKTPVKMEVELYDSLIVGRADICDVFFDDERMSRQHFALELMEDNVLITDLNTTNGTSVNGVKLGGRRKLENHDLISAGSIDITIQW